LPENIKNLSIQPLMFPKWHRIEIFDGVFSCLERAKNMHTTFRIFLKKIKVVEKFWNSILPIVLLEGSEKFLDIFFYFSSLFLMSHFDRTLPHGNSVTKAHIREAFESFMPMNTPKRIE
jgi:hypothetical protein